MPKYPREDKCKICSVHLGWIMNEMGEMVALGLCEKPECQKKSAISQIGKFKLKKPGRNGSESNKGK
jgi:hypothetical protein